MDYKQPSDEELRRFLLELYINKAETIHHPGWIKMLSDIQTLTDHMRTLTPELFSLFLAQKGIPQTCQACGVGKLSITEGRSLRRELLPDDLESLDGDSKAKAYASAMRPFVAWMTFGDEDSPDVIHKSYYPTHCQHCGNLSLYKTRTVMSWLKEQNSKESDDE
ncbi:TPA: hypothetical protein QCJ95_003681 [Enterobacter asburiae]|nr:hypothetical protein [Enterobacter asburiae]HDR2800493.1 hypothetical protein [Enterobacter asburiae]